MQLSNNFRLSEFTRSDTAKRHGIVNECSSVLYYPGHGYKRAVHLFRQELRQTRGLLQALQDVGYKGNERILTPRQVQVIEEFLGEACRQRFATGKNEWEENCFVFFPLDS